VLHRIHSRNTLSVNHSPPDLRHLTITICSKQSPSFFICFYLFSRVPLLPSESVHTDHTPVHAMNFFQKGLAGLESRLDKVLLDETDQAALAARDKEKLLPAPATAPEPVLRRSGETTRGRTTMQERLKAAVEGGRGSGSGSRSRTPAGRNSADTMRGRGSVDVSRGSGQGSLDVKREADGGSLEEEAAAAGEERTVPIVIEPEELGKEEVTNGGDSEIPSPSPARNSIERPPSPLPAAPTNGDHLPRSADDLQELLIRLQADLAICETRRAEESHAASERVDALEAKLQYLSRSSAAEARERSASTPTEKALAERDEKIALLIEEGEQLSKNELKLQTAIKKLRAKAQDEEKAAAEAKRRQEKAEKQVEDEREKTRRLQESERKLNETVKALGNIEGEIETLRKGNVAATEIIKDLEQKLDEERMRVEEAEGKAQTEALEKEKKTTLELGARLERVQSEAAMVEEKLKSEVGDLKSKVERDSEKARAREAELKAEQSVSSHSVHGSSLADIRRPGNGKQDGSIASPRGRGIFRFLGRCPCKAFTTVGDSADSVRYS
jgi:hypothetical protein